MINSFERSVARFLVEKTSCNLFLTGKAGSGKTTFLKEVKTKSEKKLVVLAPTGVAAVNAGGMTIHSFFQFGIGPYVKGVSEPVSSHKISVQKMALIRSLDLIIIDEVSMVRADLMDHISDELKRIRKDGRPFGGVQMLLIGDLYQLPPITVGDEESLLNGVYRTTHFFGSRAFVESEFKFIEFQEVFRQSDPEFIGVLNRIREGVQTREDIDYLNSRYLPDYKPGPEEHFVTLVTHNAMADRINNEKLCELPGTPTVFEAAVTRDFPKDSFPVPERLELKIGEQVIFGKNDPDRRFVNGTLGVIESINDETVGVRLFVPGGAGDGRPPFEAGAFGGIGASGAFGSNGASGTPRSIGIPDTPGTSGTPGTPGSVGTPGVSEVLGTPAPLGKLLLVSPMEWQNIRYRMDAAGERIRTEVRGVFRQLPLRPAWAITIHKSQSLTFENAAIDVASAFAPGQAYVALSRCRSLKGIMLNSRVSASSFITDTAVSEFMRSSFQNIYEIAREVDYQPFEYSKNSPRNEDAVKKSVPAINKDLFEALRRWRNEVARKREVSPFIILWNQVLAAIAERAPETIDELMSVRGMGPAKVAEYGTEILDVIAAWRKEV